MKKRNGLVKFAASALLISASLTATVNAQDGSATHPKPVASDILPKAVPQQATSEKNECCFFEGEEIVDNLPKHETSKREQEILDKTISVINRFDSQKDAFSVLDRDNNCKLDRSEVNKLLSYAKINGFIRAIATGRLISRYDLSKDGFVQWREFRYAVEKALAKQAAKEAAEKLAKEAAEELAKELAQELAEDESVKTSYR